MSKSYVPRRGDVVYLDLDPQAGHEQAGRRPAIVLSNSDYNRQTGLAVFAPITNTVKGWAWEVPIPDNSFVSGVVLADQFKSLDWKVRRPEFICSLGEDEFLEEVRQKAVALISSDADE